jgi:dihydropteroate synthase
MQQTLNCNGKLLSLAQPIVMGILNITPDSFFDGNKYTHLDDALRQTEKMLAEGATIIDIGGMSSRPGAELVRVEEELARVLPVIETINEHFPRTILSIDTVWADVAKYAIEAGAHIVNDISAGKMDDKMYAQVAKMQVPYILMHMQGKPQTMQKSPAYHHITTDITDFFIEEIGKLRALGVKDIVIDPGFGFGKTVAQNYELLKNSHAFQILDVPLLIGISRKAMIYKYLDIQAKDALHGTTALNMIALQQGAKILRVHDVLPAMQTIQLWQALKK